MDKRIEDLFGNQPVLFIKFQKRIQHLVSLQQGNLYMNNLKYFIELEEEKGTLGIGDKLETANVINNVELSFNELGTDKLVFNLQAKRVITRYDDAMYKPVFCLFAITIDMLEIVEELENEVRLKINFTDEQIDKMISEFGKYALVISPTNFKKKLEDSFNQKAFDYCDRYVEYYNININEQRRLESFANQDVSLFFYKRDELDYQKEFRIVILDKDEETAIVEDIGSLEDCSILIETKNIKNHGLCIRFKE